MAHLNIKLMLSMHLHYKAYKMRDILLVLLMPLLALGWWDVGHMLTAAIA